MVRIRGAAVLAAAGVLAAACGGAAGGGSSMDDAATPAPPASSAPAAGSPAAPGTASPGTAAAVPEKLRFTAATLDGAPFSGESLAGRPVVFWFWAPWCPKCRSEAPGVKAAREKYAARGVEFVGIASLDKLPAMKRFAKDTGTDAITQLNDEKGAVWTRLGVSEQSTFVFMRPDGSATKESGPLDPEELTGHVEKLLGDG
ncbi:TlpA family protein disulfide reductase [Bailinhaonella thermotolerans]|nr:redoxin domain-containing protein [Bailinhaonella thermotolerans]